MNGGLYCTSSNRNCETKKTNKQSFSRFYSKKSAYSKKESLVFTEDTWSTLMREIPFSLLQYPLWEMFKKIWSIKVNRNVNSLESALSGALAGGMAAAATTPLDVC
ncbi:S-adenosylmethionine mitochondrial carrier protein [Armadillidium vulgare]|nr:S-adenosylmethionine mitochondrial carrier protein [Armadillidium vulgare]